MDKARIRLEEKLRKVKQQITDYKNSCPHPPESVNYEFRGDTGNWCPSDDSYWTNYYCKKCGKMWTVDGSVSIKGTRIQNSGKLVPDND